MCDWQPIETAPKDGTHILTWDFQGWPFVVEIFWDENELGGYWAFAEELVSEVVGEFEAPQYWMPLPEPPEGTKDA